MSNNSDVSAPEETGRVLYKEHLVLITKCHPNLLKFLTFTELVAFIVLNKSACKSVSTLCGREFDSLLDKIAKLALRYNLGGLDMPPDNIPTDLSAQQLLYAIYNITYINYCLDILAQAPPDLSSMSQVKESYLAVLLAFNLATYDELLERLNHYVMQGLEYPRIMRLLSLLEQLKLSAQSTQHSLASIIIQSPKLCMLDLCITQYPHWVRHFNERCTVLPRTLAGIEEFTRRHNFNNPNLINTTQMTKLSVKFFDKYFKSIQEELEIFVRFMDKFSGHKLKINALLRDILRCLLYYDDNMIIILRALANRTVESVEDFKQIVKIMYLDLWVVPQSASMAFGFKEWLESIFLLFVDESRVCTVAQLTNLANNKPEVARNLLLGAKKLSYLVVGDNKVCSWEQLLALVDGNPEMVSALLSLDYCGEWLRNLGNGREFSWEQLLALVGDDPYMLRILLRNCNNLHAMINIHRVCSWEQLRALVRDDPAMLDEVLSNGRKVYAVVIRDRVCSWDQFAVAVGDDPAMVYELLSNRDQLRNSRNRCVMM